MENVNQTQKYLFTTWVNCRQDDIRLYRGSDGKIYGKRYGLPLYEVSEESAMYMAWSHINRTTGWPCHSETGNWIDRKVSISKEEQDFQCKLILS